MGGHFFPSFVQACLTCPVKQWSNCIVQNAWMSTLQNLHVIIIQMGPTLEQASHTCSSWSIQSTDPRSQPTSLSPDYMVSKFTHWPTRFNSKALQTSKYPCVLLAIMEGRGGTNNNNINKPISYKYH